MKKLSGEWGFLSAGLAALAFGLILRFVADLKGDTMQFIQGLCIALSLALLLSGLIKFRRDAQQNSGI